MLRIHVKTFDKNGTLEDDTMSAMPFDMPLIYNFVKNNRPRIHDRDVVILQGAPASGKSTFAKMLANKGWKRINKDDLRGMLDNGKWSKPNEKAMLSVRNKILCDLLTNTEANIVIDDTNYHPRHIRDVLQYASGYTNVYIVEFEADLDDCIYYDKTRDTSVGEDVVRRIWGEGRKFRNSNHKFTLRPDNQYREQFVGRNAIIVDLDGTLAHMEGRSPYEYHRVHEDTCDPVVRHIVNLESNNGTEIVILSGREGTDECFQKTEMWLTNHGIQWDRLYMRQEGDHRPDWMVKRELYFDRLEGSVNVLYVLDDRDSVVAEWRMIGLKTLQVDKGDF